MKTNSSYDLGLGSGMNFNEGCRAPLQPIVPKGKKFDTKTNLGMGIYHA